MKKTFVADLSSAENTNAASESWPIQIIFLQSRAEVAEKNRAFIARLSQSQKKTRQIMAG
jgi:hypothetical protein